MPQTPPVQVVNMGKIGLDEMLGAVKFEGQWHFFAADIGHWVMDAVSFSGEGSLQRLFETNYRQGVIQASEANAKQFVQAMASNELSIEEVKVEIRDYRPHHLALKILIDFDAKVFIDGDTGDTLNEHIPENWEGYETAPYHFLPDHLQALWN